VTIVVTANRAGRITDTGWVSTSPPRHWRHERHVTSWVRNMGPDLDLRLNGSPAVVNTGQQVTYTATIGNHGSGPAATVGFQDLIPNHTTLASVTPSQGSCSGTGSLLAITPALDQARRRQSPSSRPPSRVTSASQLDLDQPAGRLAPRAGRHGDSP
jgi:uncharacterized repeat protein (TIGR01451 family)